MEMRNGVNTISMGLAIYMGFFFSPKFFYGCKFYTILLEIKYLHFPPKFFQ